MKQVEQYNEAIEATDRAICVLLDLKDKLHDIYDKSCVQCEVEKRDFLYNQMRMLSEIVWDLTADEGIRCKLVTWQRKAMEEV